MPTGLTYKIEETDDYTFRDFALSCALQFGACYHQREDDDRSRPKHRKVDAYYRDRVKEAETTLKELHGLSVQDVTDRIKAETDRVAVENEKSLRTWQVKSRRYAKMRAHVEAWTPPTPDHDNMKKFMLDQITISFDDRDKPYVQTLPDQNPTTWLAHHIERAEKELERATEDLEKEERSVVEANAWIDALLASLESIGT